MVVTPRAWMARTHSTHRTGPNACSYRAARLRSGTVSTFTSMLFTTGIRGASSVVAARRSRSLSAAGFIRLEWKGAETGSAEKDEHGRELRDNVFGTLEEDARRLDFTVNALYFDAAPV